jgi:tetratricopeptide (TPR) repeat protein
VRVLGRLDAGSVENALTARAARLVQEAAGPDHPMHAQVLNNICYQQMSVGQLVPALEACTRALDIRLRTAAADSSEASAPHNNLGGIYKRLGRYDEALVHDQAALALRERSLGPDHPAVAVARNNVAWVFKEQGRLEEAEPYFRKAAEAFARVGDPRELFPLRNLGGASLQALEKAFGSAL